MNIVDLMKATVVCGGVAFLVYSFPLIAQSAIIGLLGLTWCTYLHKTIKTMAGR